jgi:nucleoside-diphosphate-sugar epimerase
MKIIVTGGAGFIGCNAVAEWMRKGHELVVIDDLSRRGADSNLESFAVGRLARAPHP